LSWLKISWLCRIFGHSFILVNDLRVSLKRERLVYRCLRCNHPLIVRQTERRQAERRKTERRSIFRARNNRRNGERRKIYNPHGTPHLLHG